MATSTTKAHRSLAVLALPKRINVLITYADNVVARMTANAYFPSPLPALATVSVAITDLQNAETATLARTKGAAATVLDPRCAEARYLRPTAVQAQPAEGEDTGLVASLLADRSGERREKAESIVAAWRAGEPVARKTVRRAAALLGLDEQQLARIRVEGGPFAGVCIELRDGEGVEDVVARFRQAMRERAGRREVG